MGPKSLQPKIHEGKITHIGKKAQGVILEIRKPPLGPHLSEQIRDGIWDSCVKGSYDNPTPCPYYFSNLCNEKGSIYYFSKCEILVLEFIQHCSWTA